LSNRMVRVVINLGVAHGSDYDRVRELLLEIARENEYTLDDPAPSAMIEKFSPGSVDFVLVAHLPNLDNTGDVRHDMLARIDREFAEAGIVMPVPTMQVRLEKVEE